MQRKRRYLLFGLVPLGAIGAVAGGLSLGDWQLPNWPSAPVADAKPSPIRTAAVRASKAPASQPVTQPSNSKPGPRKVPYGIDVARINAEGTSVIAGFAEPLTQITIMADGRPVGTVTSDVSGDWVLITSYKFANLDPKLEIKPGDHMVPLVASVSTGQSSERPVAPVSSAAGVAKQMMQRLRKLTEAETKADSAATTPTASLPGSGSASVRAGQKWAYVAPRPNAGRGDGEKVTSPASIENLPVPVQFVYRKATFTEQGREAAALLLKYFRKQGFTAVALSGHADERGTPAANRKLSKQRLETIEKYLRDGGYTGKLRLVPKGESEKYSGVDRSKFPPEALYQLDRRVEVISTQR